MKKFKNEYADYADDDPFAGIPDFSVEVPESFDKLSDGLQDDGTVLSDLGWGSMHICEDLGIEGIVGISGFESGLHFINWVRNKINLKLNDWDPISITLYQCWYQTDSESDDNNYCYMSWRHHPSTDALNVHSVKVFALKHAAFHLKDKICLTAFYIARQHSLAKDIWASRNGDAEFTPDSMEHYLHHGYHLSGIAPNTDTKKNITWPSHDLPAVLDTLESFNANGYTDLHIWADGIGFGIEDLTAINRKRLIQAYTYYGADMPFIDMATTAGII